MSAFLERLFGLAERAVVALEVMAVAQQSQAHAQAVMLAPLRRRVADDLADGLGERGA